MIAGLRSGMVTEYFKSTRFSLADCSRIVLLLQFPWSKGEYDEVNQVLIFMFSFLTKMLTQYSFHSTNKFTFCDASI